MHFLLHFLLHQVCVYFTWNFVAFLSEDFLCLQVKLELFSPEIVSALENKELLSYFRVCRKIASAQMDGRITTDGPLYTNTLI